MSMVNQPEPVTVMGVNIVSLPSLRGRASFDSSHEEIGKG